MFPLPCQISYTSSYHHTLGRAKLLISSGHVFVNMFPQTAEMGGRNYNLLYQDSIRKYLKVTWDIRLLIFCVICDFFKYDGFTLL